MGEIDITYHHVTQLPLRPCLDQLGLFLVWLPIEYGFRLILSLFHPLILTPNPHALLYLLSILIVAFSCKHLTILLF